MKKHIRYLWYIIRHKWFVFTECCRLGIPFRGLIHDWSKLLPSEWFPYVDYFYGIPDEAAFDFAWLLHQKRNKHHWQWWILPEDDGGEKLLPMSHNYRREMLADWRGAGRAIHGKDETKSWYIMNRDKMKLCPVTRHWIEGMLEVG